MDNSFVYRGKALVIGNDHYDQMKIASLPAKYCFRRQSGYKMRKRSTKLTIEIVNVPAHRAVKRVYTQFWTKTYIPIII